MNDSINLTVPVNIIIKRESGYIDVSFSNYLLQNPLKDPRFGRDYETLLMCESLRKLFAEVEGGDIVQLTQTEVAQLKDVVMRPSGSYEVESALAFLPFMTAIVNL